jgi:uncharacterized membrane protein YbhN (UPF0104 family)
MDSAEMTVPKDAATDEARWMPAPWRQWSTYVSLAGALGFVVMLCLRLDIPTIWQQVATCDKRWVVLSTLLHYVTYLVRGVRWQRCLQHVARHGHWPIYSLVVFFYNFVDNLVPAKMGDLYAAHLARINLGLSRSVALGSLVSLRMLDAWMVLLLAGFASWRLFATSWPSTVRWSLLGGAYLAIGITSLVGVAALRQGRLPRWLPPALQQRWDALRQGMWPPVRQWGAIVGLTVGLWALETMSLVTLLWAFGVSGGGVSGLFVTMLPVLASAFPLTPAGVGVVDLTLVSCLRLVGVSPDLATSITVVNRLLDYWLHIALGVLLWSMRRVMGLQTWREISGEAYHVARHKAVR